MNNVAKPWRWRKRNPPGTWGHKCRGQSCVFIHRFCTRLHWVWEVLPAKKQKTGPQKEAEEAKPMSKRKKRKLETWAAKSHGIAHGLNQSQLVVHVLFCVCTSEEQLAQKKASKEVRTEVLEQLKAINCFCTTSHGPGSWLIWLFAFCICFLIVIVVQPDDNSCRQFQHVMFLILNVASAWQSLRSN